MRLHKLLAFFVDLVLALAVYVILLLFILVFLDDIMMDGLTRYRVLADHLDPLTPLNLYLPFNFLFVKFVNTDVYQLFVTVSLVFCIKIVISKEDFFL